jgi:hypothetical protein
MYTIESEINNSVTITAQGPSSGLSAPPDQILLFNGAVSLLTVTCNNIAGPLYNMTFTPNATGTYVLYAFGVIQGVVNVVNQSLYTITKNIQDEAIGSWQWDKTAGTLVMLRQDGTALAQFTVVDNLTTSSRERIS